MARRKWLQPPRMQSRSSKALEGMRSTYAISSTSKSCDKPWPPSRYMGPEVGFLMLEAVMFKWVEWIIWMGFLLSLPLKRGVVCANYTECKLLVVSGSCCNGLWLATAEFVNVAVGSFAAICQIGLMVPSPRRNFNRYNERMESLRSVIMYECVEQATARLRYTLCRSPCVAGDNKKKSRHCPL